MAGGRRGGGDAGGAAGVGPAGGGAGDIPAAGIPGVFEQGRALLCRQAALKFDAVAGRRLAEALAGVGDADRLAEVGDWLIECRTPAELFARLAGGEARN